MQEDFGERGAARKDGEDLINITADKIKKRVLELGVPKDATKGQLKQIEKIKEYAKTQNVDVNVRKVE